MGYNSKKYNIAAAVAHSLVFIFELIILNTLYDQKTSFDTTSYITTRHPNEFGTVVTTSRPIILGCSYIVPFLICSFTGVTAVAHVLYATKLHNSYAAGIQTGSNCYRWIEYAISATIMLLIIALSSGVSDANSLFVMSVVSACVMLLGGIAEKYMTAKNRDLSTAWLATLVAWALFMAA